MHSGKIKMGMRIHEPWYDCDIAQVDVGMSLTGWLDRNNPASADGNRTILQWKLLHGKKPTGGENLFVVHGISNLHAAILQVAVQKSSILPLGR